MAERYFTPVKLLAWYVTQNGPFTRRVFDTPEPQDFEILLAERRAQVGAGDSIPPIATFSDALRKIEIDCRAARLEAIGLRGDADRPLSERRELIEPGAWLDLKIEPMGFHVVPRSGRMPIFYWFPFFGGSEVERAWEAMNGGPQLGPGDTSTPSVYRLIPGEPKRGRVELARQAMLRKWPDGKISRSVSIKNVVKLIAPILKTMGAAGASEDTVRRALGEK